MSVYIKRIYILYVLVQLYVNFKFSIFTLTFFMSYSFFDDLGLFYIIVSINRIRHVSIEMHLDAPLYYSFLTIFLTKSF